MQLGITLSSLALGALGEPAVARVIDSVVRRRLELASRPRRRSIVAFLVISILHVVIGEIVPKSYTLPRAEPVALAVAVPIRVFFFTFSWFITFLDWLAQLVMRMLGIKTTDEMEGAHSEVELRMLLRQGERSGVLEPDEQEMIDKVFDFSDTPVEHVMVPRPDIVALPVALTPTAAMEQVLQAPVHALPGLRRGVRQRARRAARAPAVRRAPERRRPTAPICARCCTRRTSCPRPSASATC